MPASRQCVGDRPRREVDVDGRCRRRDSRRPGVLRRLVVNLVQNAVQHTPAGGTVSVNISVNGWSVSIRVKDTGSGIPNADLTRIFDRFVQLDPSRRSEGAGLGLTIAKWIAEAHQGSLVVESTGPQGTTFCLALPTSARPPERSTKPQAPA